MLGLHLGDCLDILPTLPSDSVHCVIADLPYAHMSGGKMRKCTANAWDKPIDLEPLWEQLLRVGRRNAAFVFTATQPFATTLICSQRKLFRYDLVWEKSNATNFANSGRMPLRAHENVLVFYRAVPTYNPQMRRVESTRGKRTTRMGIANYGDNGTNMFTAGRERKPWVDSGLRHPRTVFSVENDQCRTGNVHPTQKPVALLEWLIKTYTHPGDTVLDPTAGSFTTGVACVQTGRSFIGIERDAGYFEIGKRRVRAAHLQQQAQALQSQANQLQMLLDLESSLDRVPALVSACA